MQKRLKGVPDLPFPPIVAGLYGIVSGFLVYSTPQWLFEHAVDMSGIAQFIPAATPPLGEKARLLCAGASVFAVALALWPALAMAQSIVRKMRKKPEVHVRARGIVIPDSMDNSVVSHLTVPHEVGLPGGARAPIFADNELGAPLMSDEALVAGEELVLDAPLDMPAPLAAPGYATPMLEDVAPLAMEPLELEPDPVVASSRLDYAQWEPTEARVTPEAFAPAAQTVAGSQFQISIPLQMDSEPEPAPEFEAPEPVAADPSPFQPGYPEIYPAAHAEEMPSAPVSFESETPSIYSSIASPIDEDALVAEWEASLPPRGKPAPAAGMDVPAPRTDPLSVSLFPPVVSEPEPVAFAEPVEMAEQPEPAVHHDVFARQSSDPMRVSLFPSEAPAPAPEPAPVAMPVPFEAVQAPEPTFVAPAAAMAPTPVAAQAPSSPDNSVGGLMARLNSAMGAKAKAAADQGPSLTGMKVSFGTGRTAF